MSEPQTNDVRERMQETARAIETHLPPGTGFALLAFDLDTANGRLEYVANGRREDIVKAMREFIAKSESSWGTHEGDRLPLKPLDTANHFEVCLRGDGMIAIYGLPVKHLAREQALNLAAWIVAEADPELAEFPRVLAEIKRS